MIPTLREGDRVLVEKLSSRFGEPERGEVVVFERDIALGAPKDDPSFVGEIRDSFRELFGLPTGSRQDFIKRIVAVGGDEIEGHDGRVYVNGRPVQEPYVVGSGTTSPFPSTRVPEGQIFVMGDNRSNSDDSRNFGAVPLDSVVGRAFVLMWPPEDFRTL
jgi:signal peptidase I